MAAKGAVAKTVIIDKLKDAFGDDFIGVSEGKVYVWALDGGTEKVQIAISMTCPKTEFSVAKDEGIDFNNVTTKIDTFKPAQIDEKELDNVRKLIAEFGL